MVTAVEYRHVPIGTLAVLAQRLGKIWASPSTWYLVRKYGWRRPRLRVNRLQQDRIHHAVDCRRRADAESQCEDRDDGKARGAAKSPSVADVLPKSLSH